MIVELWESIELAIIWTFNSSKSLIGPTLPYLSCMETANWINCKESFWNSTKSTFVKFNFVYLIFYYQEITLSISQMNFIENILNIKLKNKEKFKNDININPNLWEKRPIDKENLENAAEDVLYLIKAWSELQERFNLNMKEIVINLYLF